MEHMAEISAQLVFGFYFLGFSCLQVSGIWEIGRKYYELILSLRFLYK